MGRLMVLRINEMYFKVLPQGAELEAIEYTLFSNLYVCDLCKKDFHTKSKMKRHRNKLCLSRYTEEQVNANLDEERLRSAKQQEEGS